MVVDVAEYVLLQIQIGFLFVFFLCYISSYPPLSLLERQLLHPLTA